jgi:hypothetical protein
MSGPNIGETLTRNGRLAMKKNPKNIVSPATETEPPVVKIVRHTKVALELPKAKEAVGDYRPRYQQIATVENLLDFTYAVKYEAQNRGKEASDGKISISSDGIRWDIDERPVHP